MIMTRDLLRFFFLEYFVIPPIGTTGNAFIGGTLSLSPTSLVIFVMVRRQTAGKEL